MREHVHKAIDLELKAQRKALRSVWINIESVELLDLGPGRFIYRLELGEDVKVAADSAIKIKAPGYDQVFSVQVLMATGHVLIVAAQEPLPDRMGLVRIQFDPAFILRKLDEHLDQVLRFPPVPLKAILDNAIPVPDITNDEVIRAGLLESGYRLNESQRDAIVRIQSDLVHLVWGPPGTGKTYTLGIAVAEHLRSGKSCLLLSNSNAAVDEMVKAVTRALEDSAIKWVFRCGASADEEVNPYTALGHFEIRNPQAAAETSAAHKLLRGITLRNLQTEGGDGFLTKIEECRRTISDFEQQATLASDVLIRESRCVASTLASLVLNSSLSDREFDVVYIDEASMISLAFAFAGAAQASEQVIFAGDFRQLPPICHSEDRTAQTWFAENIFDYLEISDAVRGDRPAPLFVSMLKEQYRMTQSISNIVSDLSYGGKLASGPNKSLGHRPLFIDVSVLCGRSHFSVQEKSYYQPYSAILLHNLHKHFGDWLGPKIEFLSPFRAQRTLLQAVAKDLSSSKQTFGAKTIHKAQGSQEHTIVVDLTAHSADKPHRFFTGEDAENLINVALSRAQERLIILGSLKMIRALCVSGNYWERFLDMALHRCDRIDAAKLIVDSIASRDVGALVSTMQGVDDLQMPSVFVEGSGRNCPPSVHDLFSRTRSMTRLIVVNDADSPRTGHGVTYRHDRHGQVPAFLAWRGLLCLPLETKEAVDSWAIVHSPETTKKLSSISCGHLFDSGFEVKDTLRLLCARCNKDLILKGARGVYRLVCERGYECGYSRRISLKDAQMLIEICNMSCPECGAKPQPRLNSSGESVFVGCSNYPHCDGIVSLSIYADRAWNF